jgi:hypothetical protein
MPAVAWMLLGSWGTTESEDPMKLVNRKTRKAIEKSVRKALKKHGPALLAAVAGSLVSSIATLAGTEATGKPGKSKLTDLADRAKESVTTQATRNGRNRKACRERASEPADTEDSQRRGEGETRHPQLA